MNWDQIEGQWKQVRGKAQQKWGKLTDDDLDVVAGKRDEWDGRVQEHDGLARDEADKQVGVSRTRFPWCVWKERSTAFLSRIMARAHLA